MNKPKITKTLPMYLIGRYVMPSILIGAGYAMGRMYEGKWGFVFGIWPFWVGIALLVERFASDVDLFISEDAKLRKIVTWTLMFITMALLIALNIWALNTN